MRGSDGSSGSRLDAKKSVELAIIKSVGEAAKAHGYVLSSKSLVKKFLNGNLGVIAFQSISGSAPQLRPTVNVVSTKLAKVLRPGKSPSAKDCHASEFLAALDNEPNLFADRSDFTVFRCQYPEQQAEVVAAIVLRLNRVGFEWIENRSEDVEIARDLSNSGPVQKKWAAVLNDIVNGRNPDLSILKPTLPRSN